MIEYSRDDSGGVVTTHCIDDLIEYVRTTHECVEFSIDGDASYSARECNGMVCIDIERGTHYIGEPILIHSPNVIIEGNGSTLVGGRRAQGSWHRMAGNIMYMDVTGEVDMLYVDGVRYSMARYPKVGYTTIRDIREHSKGKRDMVSGYVHALHAKLWGGFSYKIVGKGLFGTLRCKGGTQNNRRDGISSEHIYMENILSELTEPHEWCYRENEKKVYAYIPDGECTIDTVLVTNETIFKIIDTHNVSISNMNIVGTKRTFMKTIEPLLRSDWTIYRGGAIYVTGSRDITICDMDMADIGSNAIFVDGDNERIALSRMHIHDVGASGVAFVGRASAVRSPLFEYSKRQNIADISLESGPLCDDYPRDSSISDSIIENVGMVEKQASGVELSIARNITIKWCSIYNTSRAGINIGDGTFGGHHIDGCDVFDTVRETGDHGSFNSWGRDRFWNIKGVDERELYRYALLDSVEKTIIERSRFRCDRGWDIDLDDGSSNYEIRYNLCLNGGIKLREGFYRDVHHNITVNNSMHLHVWYPNSHDRVHDNIVMTPYEPVLMDKGYGDLFDNNIFNVRGQKVTSHADALSDISHMDEHSICVDCIFDDDFHVKNTDIQGYALPNIFGVRSERLRAIVREPLIPTIRDMTTKDEDETLSMLGMRVKNIATEGEMSTYGTAGCNGVLVLDIDRHSRAYRAGVRVNDVIVNIASGSIEHLTDLDTVDERKLKRGNITVIRGQIKTNL